jgi:uncharacterized protein (DUF305 family)
MRKSLIMSGIAVAATAALVAGCSNSSSSGGMSGMQSTSAAATTAAGQQTSHNAQDVAFTQQMIPHHSQAVDMAKLAPTRSTNPKILDLASRIEKAQAPEIQQMQGWLTAWGVTTSSTSSMPGMSTSMSMPGMTDSAMPGMDHGSMPGGMTDADMKQLAGAKGAQFDSMWLSMMITHHQGAIDMAKTEIAQGSNAEAKSLAQKIIDGQQAEITEMQALQTQQ